MPSTKAGNTTLVRSTLYPSDMIQAVSVVPMLAPIITEMACPSVSRPAETNETVITVVADDDCTAHVTAVPVIIPVKRLVVIRARMWRSCGPAIFCRASLIMRMPNISSPSEPSRRSAIIK